MTPREELKLIEKGFEKTLASEVSDLYATFIDVSPVATGAFQAAWDLDQISTLKWSISNNMEYATVLFDGRRKFGNKDIGSEQWKEGGQPILDRFDRDLQKKLKEL
jgi:hypothetical protein